MKYCKLSEGHEYIPCASCGLTVTLLLGVGNTIMGDDSVGIHVVRTLKGKLGARTDLEFKELSVGGLQLVEEMLGYDTVFLIDSIESNKAGRIQELSPEEFKASEQIGPPHVTDFATALGLYRKLEPSLVPSKIRIFTIDIEPAITFSESISDAVRSAATNLADQIIHELERVDPA